MITVIDLRRLYRMPAAADMSNARILVIERGDERYGLLVDAVENIVTVADSDRIPTPALMRGQGEGEMRNDMREVIDIAAGDNGRQAFCVFDIDIFLERLLREMTAA